MTTAKTQADAAGDAGDVGVWNDAERAAWRPTKPMRPSRWAEKHRRLFKSAIPGQYRNDNAPYGRGIMDISSRPGCVQANVQKAAQVGVSEFARNLLAYWAHLEPDPVGLTFPDRSRGRKIVKRDVLPLFRRTPVLRGLLGRPSRDALIETIELLNGFSLDLMWSGSATSTASNPYRRVINDEVDKFEQWAGDEPDPIGRTEKRMRTYGDRRLQFNISTPTTTEGTIHQLLLASTIRLHFEVPCPHCGRFQRLVFSQLKWEKFAAKSKRELADKIAPRRETAVWYECRHCEAKIHDSQKTAMIRRGRWTGEAGHVVDYWGRKHADAEKVTRWPPETRIGFQISGLYSLMEHWAKIACEFLRAEGSIAASFNFRTETLGEPFEFQVNRVKSNLFADKSRRATLPAGIVPKWGWLILVTIDTQVDHFYAVVRAWGAGMRSQRIWHGKVMDFDGLDRLLFATVWPVEDDAFPPMSPALALIDSGGTVDKIIGVTRTMQVYQWVVPRQAIVRAIKGAAKPRTGLYWTMGDPIGKTGESKRKAPEDLRGWMVDTHRCNDLLADLIVRGVPGKKGSTGFKPVPPEASTEAWLLNTNDDDEYNHHMSAIHKTAERTAGKVIEKWKLVHSGGRKDYRDCEAYQIAAAHMAQVHLLPPEAELMQTRKQETEQLRRQLTNTEENRQGRRDEAWSPRPL